MILSLIQEDIYPYVVYTELFTVSRLEILGADIVGLKNQLDWPIHHYLFNIFNVAFKMNLFVHNPASLSAGLPQPSEHP